MVHYGALKEWCILVHCGAMLVTTNSGLKVVLNKFDSTSWFNGLPQSSFRSSSHFRPAHSHSYSYPYFPNSSQGYFSKANPLDSILPHQHIILEDLQSIRNLETTFYVTDSTQASDFLWKRESGLNVNVGVKRIHLLPELRDVEHAGDNHYSLNSPIVRHNTQALKNVIKNFCRSALYSLYFCSLLYVFL